MNNDKVKRVSSVQVNFPISSVVNAARNDRFEGKEKLKDLQYLVGKQITTLLSTNPELANSSSLNLQTKEAIASGFVMLEAGKSPEIIFRPKPSDALLELSYLEALKSYING